MPRHRVALIFAIALIPLSAVVLGIGIWWSITPPPVPVQSLPAQSGGDSGKDLGPFGWQWCQESPPGTENVPVNLTPTEMGVVRTMKQGPLNIEWFWCRAKSSYDLVVVHARIRNTGDRTVSSILLDFSLYDRDGSPVGNHSLAIQILDTHGDAKIEDKLASRYADWTTGTAWFMKLGRINAN